jgi:hypothetical protein
LRFLPRLFFATLPLQHILGGNEDDLADIDVAAQIQGSLCCGANFISAQKCGTKWTMMGSVL